MHILAENFVVNEDINCVIFILQTNVSNCESLLKLTKREPKMFEFKQCHLFWVPKPYILCDLFFKEHKIFNLLTTKASLTVDLFPYESDVLCLNYPNIFKKIWSNQDVYNLYLSSLAIHKLIHIHPVLSQLSPNFVAKGNAAKMVVELLMQYKPESTFENTPITPYGVNTIGQNLNDFKGKNDDLFERTDYSSANHKFSVIVFDRSVDLLSPLLTPLTYEALIYELFHIKDGAVKIPSKFFSDSIDKTGEHDKTTKFANPFATNKFVPTKDETTKQSGGGGMDLKKIILNSADEIFTEIRDKNFNAIGTYLSLKAKNLTSQFEERHHVKTIGEVKGFVSKMPYLQTLKHNLANHTTIAEIIKSYVDDTDFREMLKTEQEMLFSVDTDKVNNYIESCIIKEEPIGKVLRLICLQSFANNGLKPKVWEFYRREISQVYGYEHLITWEILVECGLLVEKNAKYVPKTPYAALNKTYNLIVEKTDEKNPHDFSYVHSIYAPLSIRMLNKILTANDTKTLSKNRSTNSSIDSKSTKIGNVTKLDKSSHIPTISRVNNQALVSSLDDHLSGQKQQPATNWSDTASSIISNNSSTNKTHFNNEQDGDQDAELGLLETTSSLHSETQTVLFVMIGGITYAEIAALRYMFRSEEYACYDYMIVTTEILNGNRWLERMTYNENEDG